MIAGLRVCVKLDHTVRYGFTGQKKEAPTGTPFDWLQVLRIFAYGTLTLNPDEEYELHGSFGFTWASGVSLNLTGIPLDVASLSYEGHAFLVPIEELNGLLTARLGHTEWDQRVAILAWETARLAQLYEVTQPIVLIEQDFQMSLDEESPSPDAIT